MGKYHLVLLYFSGLFLAEALRLPQRIHHIRDRQAWHNVDHPARIADYFVLLSVVFGFWILPIAYSFTSVLSAFDYCLSVWPIQIAIPLFLISLIIRLIAQMSLSRSWSSTLETSNSHILVQNGIYSLSRHPIYVSLVLWAVAQPFLLHNFLVGVGGAVAVILIWFVRVPREERMMIDIFGEDYLDYMRRTGLFFPR